MQTCMKKATMFTAALLLLPRPHFAGEIKIGVAEALTGPIAKYGVPDQERLCPGGRRDQREGGRQRATSIILVIEDEQGKKEEAINVFKKFIFQDKVLAIFGPTLSNSAFAADPIANPRRPLSSAPRTLPRASRPSAPTCFATPLPRRTSCPMVVTAAKKKLGLRKGGDPLR